MALLLTLLILPASAFGWRYAILQEGELVYEGPLPPVDLSYPSVGQPTPTMAADEIQRGQPLTPGQFASLRSRPHLVIVPSGVTQGRRLQDDETPRR